MKCPPSAATVRALSPNIDGAALLAHGTYLFNIDPDGYTEWTRGLSPAEFEAYVNAFEQATGSPLPPLSAVDKATWDIAVGRVH